MVSDSYPNTSPPNEAKADGDRLRDAASREASSARTEAERAGSTIKDQATRLASGARDKAYEGAESGKAYAASNLEDFTAAIRKASDELGERDQSMAANLVREAASGLEEVSRSIQGKSVQELTRSAAGFARRQPAAFLIGAALAGVALGRFARASSEHDDGYDAGNRYGGSGARDDDRRYGGSDAVSGSSGGYTPSQGGYSGVSGSAATPSSTSAATSTPSGATSSSSTGYRPAGSSTSTSAFGSSSAPDSITPSTTTPGATSTPGTASTTTTRPVSAFGTPASSTVKPGDDNVR